MAIVSASPQHLKAAQDQLQSLGHTPSAWHCDVSDVSQLTSTLEWIHAHHGAIDILVNCAGILDLSEVEDTTEEMWDAVLDINLKGTFFMTQKCLPYLKAGTDARIINIASNAGRMGGYANAMSYTASKGGMFMG